MRQVYALAAALCERTGEEFPETREAASAAIERLRVENGHPSPRSGNPPPRSRRGPGGRGARGPEPQARAVAAALARELR